MNEAQATLHQLQLAASESLADRPSGADYMQTVELSTGSPLQAWLRLSAVFAFLLCFSLHQYYLAVTAVTETKIVDVAPPAPKVIEPEEYIALTGGDLVADVVSSSMSPSVTIAPGELLMDVRAQEQVIVPEAQSEQIQQLNQLKQKQLDLLYKNAAIALSKDRLMTPESDNAMYYFRSMLEIDGSDERALSGYKAVASRYRTLAVRLAKKGDITAAAQMLQNAEAVQPQQMSLGDLIAVMPTGKSAEPKSKTEQVDVDPRQVTQQQVAVTRTSGGKVDDAKFLAKQYLAAGQARDAAMLLNGFMPQSATDGEFIELLHQAYLNSNQASEALNLRVTLQGALPPHHIAKMQAAELIQSGRPAEAIGVLEKSLPSYQQDSAYYGLLAGLYYRVQRYADAEQAYEKLLGVAPEVGSYWLGYAVALDAQSDKRALGAFKKAQSTLPAQDAARQYVEQRVRELTAAN